LEGKAEEWTRSQVERLRERERGRKGRREEWQEGRKGGWAAIWSGRKARGRGGRGEVARGEKRGRKGGREGGQAHSNLDGGVEFEVLGS